MKITRTMYDRTMSFLRDRKVGYQLFFKQPAGQFILQDLLKFSHWIDGPVGRTNEETWRLIGRQDVIRRIQQHTNLTVDQLFTLYNGQITDLIEGKEENNG